MSQSKPPSGTSIPTEYYPSPPPAPGLRRSSISSTVSWDSSCDSSLPSTPGGTGFGFHPAQQKPQSTSYTDSLLLEEDMDEPYSTQTSIAPKLLSIYQYPHPHPPAHHQQQQHHHQHNYQHHHNHRHRQDPSGDGQEMSDVSSSPSRSRSECGDSTSQSLHHLAFLRKTNSLDTGLDHRRPHFPAYPEPSDLCESLQSLSYSPNRHQAGSPDYPASSNMFDYPTAASCNDPASTINALHICYYPASSQTLHSRKRGSGASSAKKPTAFQRLPVVVSSEDKPHVCNIGHCSARFKRQEHLRRHERTHTDERPFSCDVCSRKFSRTDNLRMHRKTHMKKTGRNQFVPGLE